MGNCIKATVGSLQAHLKISGESIELKKSVKYLGFILDNEMKWKVHISRISSKIFRAIGIIKYARKVLPTCFLKCYIWGQLNRISDITAVSRVHVESLPAKPQTNCKIESFL